MVIFKQAEELERYIKSHKAGSKKVHFVPTMGALHEGHISLVNAAKAINAIVVASIFVNPTQFNDKSDFENYPVSQGEDIALLIDAGCDVLFIPSVSEIYPGGYDVKREFNFGHLDTILEAAHRPGHFAGVSQVVNRLLEIVKPDAMYLGQKDYQQCMVLKAMINQLNALNPELVICPTVREQDGLAMSSRNRRLTETQRALAGVIYQCLVSIQAKRKTDPFSIVQKECIDLLKDKGFEPDYVEIAKADNLELLPEYSDAPSVALIAAKIGEVRLIDNMLLN
jgi:pantoate--beta-alanine ligase